ncbi:Catabolite control protein A [Thermoflexales bacterium]|nr:Catabolite control protein A [Thermoflexales bacterium]
MTPLTLEEIAALAGVSRSTVSRAINQQPRVSAEVRERVQHIMACTGYAPNTAAQLLAQRRLPLIAIVVTEPAEALFGNPQLAQLLGDIATACQFNRCLCVLYLFSGTDLPAALHAPQIDGVIVVGGPTVGGPTDRVVAQLRGRGLPSIVIDRFSPPDHPDLAATIKHLLPPRTPRGSSNA